MIESLYRKWLTSFKDVYTETKVISLVRLDRELTDKGVILIAGVKKNKKPKMMKLWNRLMLRKRFIIETVFD
nr:transposase [Candidatus Enterovibrio escacola]